MRPGSVETVVRLAAKEKDVGGQLLLLFVGAQVRVEERADPASMRITGLAARCLHHTVKGDKLSYDQRPHRTSFLTVAVGPHVTHIIGRKSKTGIDAG